MGVDQARSGSVACGAAGSGDPAAGPDLREIVNAILYVARTGMAWEHLPHDFPKAKTVYDYYASRKSTAPRLASTIFCGRGCVRHWAGTGRTDADSPNAAY